MTFPPIPVYPEGIDSDYTLFLVYDTTETKISTNNSAWAQEIDIVPVNEDEDEIWADNGFANIEDELLYYDSVEKNEHGKVVKLKNCERQIGGEASQYNKKGTWIRSYVVAEQRNQLVDCALQVENFVGRNFDPRQETLDWRIRNLQELQVIFDDFSCPDINFTFNIIENSPTTGVLAEYLVQITPPGSISSFRLDFGDGDFTTTALSGEHRYALNARIDPVVRASNDKCQMIQTPVERDNPAEPPPEIQEAFDTPIPEFGTVPDFTFVPFEVPEPDINLAPIITPCISLENIVPSITLDLNLISNITITTTTGTIPSIIQVIDTIPEVILLDPPIPPTIIIDPPIPPTIILVPPQSSIALELDASNLPRLEVDWGVVPEMEVTLSMARSVRTPERFAADETLLNEFGSEFADLFEAKSTMKVDYETAGIPSEIFIIPPEQLPDLRVDASELNDRTIKLDCSELKKMPTSIQIFGPESPLPTSITIDPGDLANVVQDLKNIKPFTFDISNIPTSFKLEIDKPIPERIIVDMPKPIPDTITVNTNMPETITLVGPASIPIMVPPDISIPVRFPDKMPQVEMVWNGAPIEVKISMEQPEGEGEEGNCVKIIPCKK